MFTEPRRTERVLVFVNLPVGSSRSTTLLDTDRQKRLARIVGGGEICFNVEPRIDGSFFVSVTKNLCGLERRALGEYAGPVGTIFATHYECGTITFEQSITYDREAGRPNELRIAFEAGV